VSIMMTIYLALSLLAAGLMNWFNRRHALKGAAA